MIREYLRRLMDRLLPPPPSEKISIPSGKEIGRGIVEALEEEKDRVQRNEELRKYAEEKRRGPLPVMTSVPDRDRLVHFDRDDECLIPFNLTEEQKQILEDFYRKE